MDENLAKYIIIGVFILIVYTSININVNIFKMRKRLKALAEERKQYKDKLNELDEIMHKQRQGLFNEAKKINPEDVHEGNPVMTHEEMEELRGKRN